MAEDKTTASVKPKSIIDKLVRNKEGEISLTKMGLLLTGLGGAFMASPPAAIVAIIAKYVVAFGATFTALGALSKGERKTDED